MKKDVQPFGTSHGRLELFETVMMGLEVGLVTVISTNLIVKYSSSLFYLLVQNLPSPIDSCDYSTVFTLIFSPSSRPRTLATRI
jgi:hypothetical protein